MMFIYSDKGNVMSTKKISKVKFCENKVGVAAAALMGGPSRCSHSNFSFANFQCFSNILRGQETEQALTSPLNRQNS